MRPWNSLPRSLLYSVAAVFCLVTSLYSFLWMYDVRNSPSYPVEIGFNRSRDTTFDASSSCISVYNVEQGSPADQAGLRPSDEIIGVNGIRLTSLDPFEYFWTHSAPGDRVDLTVRRPGQSQPVNLHAIFRSTNPEKPSEGFLLASARYLNRFFPAFFLLVGFAVLFLRIDDPYAWLLAALFAAFIAAPSFRNVTTFAPSLALLLYVFRSLFGGMLSALLYIFFAQFPERSPIDRRAPWLKWFALLFGLSQALPGLATGNAHWPDSLSRFFGYSAPSYVRLAISYSLFLLAVASLLSNSLSKATSIDARRKSRVMLWGTLIGIVPIILEKVAADLLGVKPPTWLDDSLPLLVFLLYPLSFAYAVVKHRVLEIPALLRRSARYVLVQRGYNILLFLGALLAIFFFTRFFSGFFVGHSQFGMALSAFFGVALIWASGPVVKRGTQRIDRAFFRTSYDARLILQDLADKTRSVTDRHELAALLDHHLTQALHPQSLAFYFRADDDTLVAAGRSVPPELATLPADSPFFVELAARGRAFDVPPPGSIDAPDKFTLAPLSPECLVPMVGHGTHLVGLLVLGQPLSEEPYSSEDKRLLDSVAGQSAIALENFRLAQNIAERMETERRAAHEMDIARDVQSRLFPQVRPPLATLEYAGACMQARQVGGDYYDFLDLGSSRLAFVLADISGKGIAGALLMANLQANLRSRYAIALDDLPRLLSAVNQLFFDSTPDDRYATLFVAVYDNVTRQVEYANCGHNAPLLFRTDGSIERLHSTSTVIGMSANWECVTQKLSLAPGDLLVIYTDGVTEANDACGNEFGEARLVELVRANLALTPVQLISQIQSSVMSFSANNQFDDLTLVLARAR
jgi:sigma-B regulation protein RsbU (phosphoserine phosphatase)